MNNKLVAAAVSGLIIGASFNAIADDKKDGHADHAGEHHACKGKNACKAKGGCKTDKHACKGKNECKGQGGCKAS
jgi:hypothetical protein